MKLLYINAYIPYPLNSGGNQAFFMMADHVRKHHDLSLLLYVHDDKEQALAEELQALWPDMTFYLYRSKEQEEGSKSLSPYASMPWLARTSCTFFDYLQHSMQRKIARRQRKYALHDEMSSQPRDFVRENSTLFKDAGCLTPQFCQFVKEVSHKGFDVVQVEFYEYLPLVYVLPETCKKVFVHHELRFVRNANEFQLFTHPLASDHILLAQEKAQELAALSACDAVITLTDIDRDILQHYLPAERLFVSPAITQAVQQQKKTFTPASDLVFVGSGAHFPNADALMWFCQQIVPLLRARQGELPGIHVTGKWSRELQERILRLCPEIIFEGIVEDLPAFLNGKISIVPIRIGSGMRMKILDAFSAASPLVTTSKGCEGLPVQHQQHCLIADTPEAFADAVLSLQHDVALQQQLAQQAQASGTPMLNPTELYHRRLSVYDALRP